MINSRALIITGFLLLVFALLITKLFSIQISKHEYYSLIADRQQNKPDKVKAERGTIKDIKGDVLSFTKDNVSFYVDKRMMNAQRVDSIVSLFSRVFDKSADYYKKLIEDGMANICIEKKVSMDKALQIKKKVIEGLFDQEDYTRVYPYGSLCSHVLGYVNRDMIGVEGIEKYYDNLLTGSDGLYTYERDVIGRVISVDEKNSHSSVPGNNLILTIDKTYQKILEEELAAGLEKFGGQSAVGIIMNPNTGEIKAFTNYPDFDPANYELFPANNRRNRALTDSYEPGSTMKPIVMSILLDQNLVKENEVVNTENGEFIYRGKKYVDSHKYESLTVKQVIEHSSDIGMIKLTKDLDDEILYKYIRDFGFSSKTMIDLPSEADGFLKKPNAFSGLTKASLSFGYEISVTPLQMLSAYCALVNGGYLFQPFVVKRIIDPFGKVIEEYQPRIVRTVISKSTSDKIKDFMIGVVENGTAKSAQLENVLVGGKTGTAEILSGNTYSNNLHNSSFIGFFPADRPNIVCYILVTSPEKAKYGGDVAAPIFQHVAKRLIETDLNLAPNKKKIDRKQNLIDELVTDIQTKPKVKSTSFANIAEKSLTNIIDRKIFSGDKTAMPNLVNQSIRDAIAQLTEMGIKYKVMGSGRVVWQNLEPGSKISLDSICLLKCEPSIKKISVSSN